MKFTFERERRSSAAGPVFLFVLFLSCVTCGCNVREYVPEITSGRSRLPLSSSLLGQSGLQTLKYTAKRTTMNSSDLWESTHIWSDASFIEDAKATLRYQYETKVIDQFGRKEATLEMIGLDVASPVDSGRARLVSSFFLGMERLMKLSFAAPRVYLMNVHFAILRDTLFSIDSSMVVRLERKELPRRGPFLGVEVCEASAVAKLR